MSFPEESGDIPIALVKYIVGGELSCDISAIELRRWRNQIGVVTVEKVVFRSLDEFLHRYQQPASQERPY